MKAHEKVMVVCDRIYCARSVSITEAVWKNGLPYCSSLCLDVIHPGQAPDAPPDFVPLQEQTP